MTDKQIIIDGVDISKCKYYDEVFNYCNQPYLGEDGLLKNIKNPKRCDCSPNCYFKQLKRKEQKLSNICKTFDIEYVIDKETGSLIGRCNKLNKKQQECEKYKQAFDAIEEFANRACDACKEFTPNRQSDISCRYCIYTQILNIINKVKE